MESFNPALFEQLGLPTNFVQDNVSKSRKGVIRGLHIQKHNPQGKLVLCLEGSLQDVAIDLRPDSPTRGQITSALLYGHQAEAQLFWIPPGFGHDFLALEDSLISYKCTTPYDQTSDGGVHPLCAGVRWLVHRDLLPGRHISAKDNALPSLVDYLRTPE